MWFKNALKGQMGLTYRNYNRTEQIKSNGNKKQETTAEAVGRS